MRTLYKTCRRCLVLMGLLLASAGLGSCQSVHTEKSSGRETIRIGVDKFEPYSYLDLNGNFAGIDVELAREALRRLNYEPEFQIINWEDKNSYLQDGSIDCIWSCYSMNDREDQYEWGGPYMYSRQVVAVRSDSEIHTLQDLEGKRIGVQATTKGENLFLHVVDSELPEALQVNSFATTAELFAVLRKGYVDAIAGHEALIAKILDGGNAVYRILDESPSVSQIGAAFLKDTHQELASELTEVLKDMQQDGTMAEIVQKYGLDPEKVIGGDNER